MEHDQNMKHAYFALKYMHMILASLVPSSPPVEKECRKIEHLNKRSKEIVRNA